MLRRLLSLAYHLAFPFSALSGILAFIGAVAKILEWPGCDAGASSRFCLTIQEFFDRYYAIVVEVFCISAALFVTTWLMGRVLKYLRMRRAIKNSYFAAKSFDGLNKAHQEVCKLLVRKEVSDARLFETMMDCYNKTEEVLNEIARFYGTYTGRECHVSLKTFELGTAVSSRLTTFARDNWHTPVGRQQIDDDMASFEYSGNTAFKSIIDDARCRFYVSNHLNLRWLFGLYHNKNPHWRKHYNSTLVLPIADQYDRDKLTIDTVIGFLCVDNRGGGFDRGLAAFSGRFFARLLYPVIIEFRRLEFVTLEDC